MEASEQSGRADRIRSLADEWLKSGDDRIPDELANLFKTGYDVQRMRPRNHRILKRYKEARLSIHFHFSRLTDHAGDGIIPIERAEVCAVVKSCDTNHDIVDLCAHAPHNIDLGGCGHRQVEHSVLIDDMESIENGQRMIRSAIRLQCLDCCHGLFVDAVESLSFLHLHLERSGVATNRKLVLPCNHMGRVGFNKAAHEVVETGSQIEQTIPDDDAQEERRMGKQTDDQGGVTIRVQLWDKRALAIAQYIPDFPYRVEMFFCPIELQADAIEPLLPGSQ